MNTAYKALFATLFFATPVVAQNNLVPVPPTFKGPALLPQLVASATITFCTSAATGTPCSPIAQAYADSTNGSPINQSTNPLKTDALGNAPVFYAAPGQYSYTVTGAAIGAPQGPYQITVSCIPGTTCVAAGSPNTFTALQTMSAGLSVTGGAFSTTQQLASTVSTGTAPFSVASTTQVANLNASQLGGLSPPASAIVGVSDVQTLSGPKTLTSPVVTNPTINGQAFDHRIIGSNSVNFGTPIGSSAFIASAINPATYIIGGDALQLTAGVGCGAGSNTATLNVIYTPPSGVLTTVALGTFTISANGVVGNTTSFPAIVIIATPGTAINYSATSVLASAGCSTIPQYGVDLVGTL